MKKTILSGVKPTGKPHLGTYFGVMKQYIDLQDEYDQYLMVADLHSLTGTQDKEKIKASNLEIVAAYVASGIDIKKSTLFKQSDVPAHTELTWILNCLTTMPYLMRAHAFKDSEAKNKEINVGVFDYPVLMAADILLYGTDAVPIGRDQKQHIEIARDLAQKFNQVFGETFKLPEEIIKENVAVVPGLDGRKMSKSYGNTIPLNSSPEEIDVLVAKIVTDSKLPEEPKDPETNNIFNIHKLLLDEEKEKALRERYEKGGLSYKEAKEMLAADLKVFLGPIHEKMNDLLQNEGKLLTILKKAGKKANQKVDPKIQEIREKVGLKLY